MVDAVLGRPGRTLAAALAVTLLLGSAATGLRFDNTPDAWLPATGDALADYQAFRMRFGDDSLIVAFSDRAAPEDRAWRAAFAALAHDLRALPGIHTLEAPRLEAGAGPSSPLSERLLSADGRTAALALFPEEGLAASERSRLVARIESVLAAADPGLGTLRLAGADVITHDLDAGSRRSLGGLAPLVFALMCAVFYGATRSLRAVGAMLAAVVAGSVGTLGLVALADRTLNLVVAVIPAIVAIVTCAQTTHLLSRFQTLDVGRSEPADRERRIRWWREAVAACWRPCLLSAVTTAAGFGSLAVSGIAPVRDLGVFTAAGVLLSFLLSFSVVPALLVLSPRFRPRTPRARWWTPGRAVGATAALRRRAPLIVGAGVAATALCSVGMTRLELESHILRFFPPDHRVPRTYAALERDLLALTPIELEIEGSRQDVLAPATLEAFDAYLARAFASEPLLRQVISPLGDGRQDPPAAVRAAALRALPGAGDAPLPAAIRRYVWTEGDRMVVRTTLAARTSSSNACDALVRRLRGALEAAFPARVEARITGGATLLIRGQTLLLDTQVRSFAVAFAVVTLVIACVFRSARVIALSLVANLMPILHTLGLMGLLGVPLDTATVTVAGIALGLIVDDTIHFLHEYRRSRLRGTPVGDAISGTLYSVGRPLVVTSAAVALGFGAFAFSSFRPTLYFGLLIAWTSLAAILCDLVVLPALLQLRADGSPGRRRAVLATLTATLALGCVGPSAPPVSPVNLDSGVALHGYDPVAYFTRGGPARGDPAHRVEHRGATYWFANEEHRALFQAEPARYLPRYGGYCAYAVSVDRIADIDPDYWSIVGGRLYLNAGPLAQWLWKRDEPGRIQAADRHWIRLGGPAPGEPLQEAP